MELVQIGSGTRIFWKESRTDNMGHNSEDRSLIYNGIIARMKPDYML